MKIISSLFVLIPLVQGRFLFRGYCFFSFVSIGWSDTFQIFVTQESCCLAATQMLSGLFAVSGSVSGQARVLSGLYLHGCFVLSGWAFKMLCARSIPLCRGYRLLEIGFWAFYGCFLMNAIGQRFRVICHVFSLRRRCFVRKRRRVFSRSACAAYFCRTALLAGCCRLLRKSSYGKACGWCAGQVFCNRRYWIFLLGSLFIVRRFLPAWRFPGRQTPLAGGLRR